MNGVLSTRDCMIHEEDIYYYAAEADWIVKMDKTMTALHYVPIREYNQIINADCCARVMDSLYFLSVDGTCLWEYELKEGTCHNYPIDCGRIQDGNFIAIFSIGNDIYIFPRHVKQVLIFHCDSKEFSIWCYPQPWADITFQSACQQNEKVWMFSNGGEIVCIDLKTYQWEFFKTDIGISDIVHTALRQELVYILLGGGEVCIWDTVGKEACFLEIQKEQQRNKRYIRMAFVEANRCVLLPAIGEYIETYDLETGRLISAEDITAGRVRIEGREHWAAFRGYSEDSEWYYFMSHAYREHLRISKKTGSLSWHTPQYPSKADWLRHRMDGGETLFYEGEQSSLDLCTYIDSLVKAR